MASGGAKRAALIVEALSDAFGPLMTSEPAAFRSKFRKMASDPHAFYRGSAPLFYADMARLDDPYADERTGRVWIHGDLHAENFGTYMNAEGLLVFDVNDFDEAYIGSFSWDLRRFVASWALLGWQKALPDDDIRSLATGYLLAYVEQIGHYLDDPDDDSFALRLDNTDGPVHAVLLTARLGSRIDLLESITVVEDYERRFRRSGGARELPKKERSKVEAAFRRYLNTIPERKREHRDVFYDVKDVVGKQGFGIGSAGLPAYNLLIEGYNQALENDIVLTMKQGNVAAAGRIMDDAKVNAYFDHEGHRTVLSQRALQVHTDPFLGHTTLGGTGFVVAELSPYEADLDWADLTEPEELAVVLTDLGRATAKVHCVSDQDSEENLVDFQTEEAIAEIIGTDADSFVDDLVEWGMRYADQVRTDHSLFVEAFRSAKFDLVSAT